MLKRGVAKRYAEALFDLAQEQNTVKQLSGEMRLILEVVQSVPEFQGYMDNFLVSPAEKKETLQQIFADKVSAVVGNFIGLLVDKRRENYVGMICEEFLALHDEMENIRDTELYTATEISGAEINALADKLSQATGYTIRIKANIDPGLIAGVKLRIGDRIVDGTLKKQLEILGSRMKYA
jgi:F-type H+-transporting ATPase subunit delta